MSDFQHSGGVAGRLLIVIVAVIGQSVQGQILDVPFLVRRLMVHAQQPARRDLADFKSVVEAIWDA